MLKKFFRVFNLPAYTVMLIILVMMTSSLTGVNLNMFPHQDKLMHFLAFMSLSFCFCLWIRDKRWEHSKVLYGFVVLFACSLFGILTEYLQSFIPSRSASVYDWIADLAGALMAIVVYAKLKLWLIIPRLLK